jgi:hypothetical protein
MFFFPIVSRYPIFVDLHSILVVFCGFLVVIMQEDMQLLDVLGRH